jgi:hypothetical protein
MGHLANPHNTRRVNFRVDKVNAACDWIGYSGEPAANSAALERLV